MEIVKTKGVFIVWKKFQRRVEVLAPQFELEVAYFHYTWEEKSKFHKTLSYFLKTVKTLRFLFHEKPTLVFAQLPPTLVLYYVALYSWLTGARFVTDCHNSMVYGHWYKWVFAKKLLNTGIMIVHNDHVAIHVKNIIGITPFVLRTGITKKPLFDDGQFKLLKSLGLSPKTYVILPWNISGDEPLQEVIEAARLLPDIQFVMTWYSERLSSAIRNNLPPNFIMTGYLQIGDFNQLFANAVAALVLTNRDGTQLSGMHEAMAFEIPAIISDLKTTRFLYKNAPVYVRNEPVSIAEGVRSALNNNFELEERIKGLRIETEKEYLEQIRSLKAMLNMKG